MAENQDTNFILQFLCDCDSFVYNRVTCKPKKPTVQNIRQPDFLKMTQPDKYLFEKLLAICLLNKMKAHKFADNKSL